jgi:serine/threonine protein kinase
VHSVVQIGSQLGRFKLEHKLGEGSTGMVYLAQDTLLNIKVALKVLSPTITKAKAFERLGSEVLLARRVSHPGVCRIFDIHAEGEILFVTMEYVEGLTLEQILKSQKRLEVIRAANLTCSICRALNAAHQQGVIHRGLTPSNIVIRPNDSISITDFGLVKARDIAETTGTGAPLETIHYMSPEVLSGKPPTAQSDIYSLGAILYRCLTGSLPFQGSQIIEVTNAVLEGRLVRPQLFNPDLPQTIEKLITTAMAVQPEARFTSINQFRQWIVENVDGVVDSDDSTDKPPSILDMGAEEPDDDKSRHQTQQIRINQTIILFSDIIGITNYFDTHGNLAGRKRIQQHNEVLFPVVQHNHGTIVKTIGDAIMAQFDFPDEGVEAAIEMQHALDSYNKRMAHQEDKIFIRIGLHAGQAIIEDQDVFGDAVNVASRICSKASGREILISEFTKNGLRRTKNFTKFHSTTTLKGKAQDYNLFEIVWDISHKIFTPDVKEIEDMPTEVGNVSQAKVFDHHAAITPLGGTPKVTLDQASGQVVPAVGPVNVQNFTEGITQEIPVSETEQEGPHPQATPLTEIKPGESPRVTVEIPALQKQDGQPAGESSDPPAVQPPPPMGIPTPPAISKAAGAPASDDKLRVPEPPTVLLRADDPLLIKSKQQADTKEMSLSNMSQEDAQTGEITEVSAVTETAGPITDELAPPDLSARQPQTVSVASQQPDMPFPPVDESKVSTKPSDPSPLSTTSGSPVVVVSSDTRTEFEGRPLGSRKKIKPMTLVIIGVFLGMVVVAAIFALYLHFQDSGEVESGDVKEPGQVSDPANDPVAKPSDPPKTPGETPDETPGENGATPGNTEPGIDPGKTEPIDTEPLVPDEKVPTSKVAGPANLNKLNRLRKIIRHKMSKSGIIFGDNKTFDGEYRKMQRLSKKARHADAYSAGVRAHAILKKIKIDKPFVQAKLLRFNDSFDKIGDTPAATKLENLSMKIMAAFEAKKYSLANGLLNQSFKLLRKKR